MKTERKKKEKSWDQVFKNKRKYCVGTEPSAILYIGILVTSTTTGHDGSVVSALASQAKGSSIPSCGRAFFSHKYFPSSLSEKFSRILSGARPKLAYSIECGAPLYHSLVRTLSILSTGLALKFGVVELQKWSWVLTAAP